jgi:hypothetical protein
MKGADPALEVKMGFPEADYIVSVFKKLHLQSERIARAASKTIISLIFRTLVRVAYLLHNVIS